MREVNLFKSYQFGKALSKLDRLEKMSPKEVWVALMESHAWIFGFVGETNNLPMKNTHTAVEKLRKQISEVCVRIAANSDTDTLPIEDIERHFITRDLEEFEREFEIDSRHMGVFGVTQKGDKSIRILLEEPESKFPYYLVTEMPHQTIFDIKESAKCLAFDRATACAFHVCRATEGLMRGYYKKLTGNDWPPAHIKAPNWKVLVDQLRVEGAPIAILQRLDEIREDRNSYAHPDASVSQDDAVVVYDLCTNIMHLIALEMKK